MTIKIELAMTNWVLMNEIANPEIGLNDVAHTYRLAVQSSQPTNWREVNEAIIKRWGKKGLARIKKLAAEQPK